MRAKQRGAITAAAERLTKGQINRRRFIMSAVASGVTLPTATALATKAEAKVPVSGGTVRIATGSLPGGGSGFDTFLARTTGNTLTRITSDDRVVGELASRIETDPHHHVWRLTLREGLTWQSGAPVRPPEVAEFLVARGIEGVEQGDGGVTIRLPEHDADFARRLAAPAMTLRHAQHGATGGYVLEHLTDDRATLVRNPHYWKDGAAHFDAVEIRAMPDAAARHRAVITGDVDFADDIAPSAVATLEAMPTLNVLETPETHHLSFPMRTDVPPFDNAVLRDALARAIDPGRLLEATALGRGTAMPNSAGGLLGEVPASVPLHLSEAALSGSLAAAEVVRDQAASAGITVTLEDVSAHAWPRVSKDVGWRVTRGAGAPATDAMPGLRLNSLAAYSANLAHPERLSATLENDAYRIADRWWFAAPA
ncbi:MAG: ABC transporter substrate-binding protein [Pseudomonadota bacterium]